ncbi:CPW-WPC family protein, putative [Plasmodium relictum]|uniref:CPW-WPC family protein, putative n=1 Tax=Plasmodium relictum TaxID=85471 RepID=A0A1J1HCE7_PLARL|nr:CPW-WPC family protein, putative [Plasmodium relictum]CRH02774.1 CPW-WPC family protein, putative [Plasmodium relictum]
MCSSKYISFFLIFLIITINCFNKFFLLTYTINDNKNKLENLLNITNNNNEFNDLSSFSEELIKSFSFTLKNVPLVLLKEKVKNQVIKASNNLNLPNPDEELCEINYSELCPENWINFGDGMNCLSPINYKGPCEKKVSFKNATAISKYKFSIECHVSWPCTGTCIEDFSKECPYEWILNKDICEAPKSYKGKCVKKKKFSNFSEAEKKIWSDECNINWPCYDKNYDFNILCPINWKMNPDHKSCLAPVSYIGPCVNILYLFDLNEKEKLSLGRKCNIEWPTHVKKELDLNSLCPIGWKISDLENIVCNAPLSYNGPCGKKISFENFSKEEKLEFSQKCDVQWALLDEKLQNFDLPCPYNWVLVEKEENICISPVEYQGPCENIFSFKNYTKEMKSAWSSSCNTVFINGNVNNIEEINKHRENKILNKKKIFGISKKNTFNLNPSINNGPIGYKGSLYEGEVLNADDETEYLPNKSNLNYSNKIIEIEDIGDRNDKNFILTDEKVKDLILLKESSDDEGLRASIDETIKNLKGKYSKEAYFSFIEIGMLNNLYNNNKLENEYNLKEDIYSYKKNEKEYKDNNENDDEYEHKNKYDYEDEHEDDDEYEHKNKYDYEDEHEDDDEYEHKNKYNYEDEHEDENESDINKNYLNENSTYKTNMGEILYEDNITETKNLYENYKIENENFSYNDICLEKDYTKCPIGWTQINNKECLAPKSYIKNLRKCSSILNIGDIVKNVYDVAHNMSFVTVDIEERKKLEKKCNIKFPCKECERDYVRVNCPLGWTDIGDGNCKAPNDYSLYLKELCNTVVNFKYTTPVFKRNWSYLCKSDWPCFSVCEKNYGNICPLGYKLINERIEKNNENIYVCANEYWKEYNYSDFGNEAETNICHVIEIYNSTILKKEIERKCKVTWPCLNKCEENFYQTCPYNWLLKDNKCIAPYYYNPPKGCENSFDILSFNIFDKYLFSNRCFAPWPCRNSCQQDWSNSCPDEWILTKRKINNNKNIRYFCKSSDKYKGICDEEYDLTDFTFLQKQDFSFRCSVKWPCGNSLHHSRNWQKENIYNDTNFKKLNTLKFYSPYYSSLYKKYKTSFF